MCFFTFCYANKTLNVAKDAQLNFPTRVDEGDDDVVAQKLKEKMEVFKKMKEELNAKKKINSSTTTTTKATTTTTTPLTTTVKLTTTTSSTIEETTEYEGVEGVIDEESETAKPKLDDRFIINAPTVCKKGQSVVNGKCRDISVRVDNDEETTTETGIEVSADIS